MGSRFATEPTTVLSNTRIALIDDEYDPFTSDIPGLLPIEILPVNPFKVISLPTKYLCRPVADPHDLMQPRSEYRYEEQMLTISEVIFGSQNVNYHHPDHGFCHNYFWYREGRAELRE